MSQFYLEKLPRNITEIIQADQDKANPFTFKNEMLQKMQNLKTLVMLHQETYIPQGQTAWFNS